MSLLRIVAPPTCPPKGTRFEIRLPGADLVPHHALAGIIGAGLQGIETNAKISVAPNTRGELLPTDLKSAIERFRAPESCAISILGPEFVEYLADLKMHEVNGMSFIVAHTDINEGQGF